MIQLDPKILINVRAKFNDVVLFIRKNSSDSPVEASELSDETGTNEASILDRDYHLTLTGMPPMSEKVRFETLDLVLSVVDEFSDESEEWFSDEGIELKCFNDTGQQVSAVRDTDNITGWSWVNV